MYEPPHGAANAEFLEALIALDGPHVRQLLQGWVSKSGVDAMIIDLVIPVVGELERMWVLGRFSVLHERHVATLLDTVLGSYLMIDTPVLKEPVVLACPPGETHDIRQTLFAVLLQHRNVATVSLGVNVPWARLVDSVRALRARGCAIYVSHPNVLAGKHHVVRHLGGITPIFIAGLATNLTQVEGVQNLPANWADAADFVATHTHPVGTYDSE